MTSLEQVVEEGRVFRVTVEDSNYNGKTVEVSFISSSTADGKKTVIKKVTIFDLTGKFTIEDADLITLFGSINRANQVDFAIYHGNTQLLRGVYKFSETPNSFDTYLLPTIVPDLTFQNNDRRVTLTFNVETIGEVNGIINHSNKDIESVTYYIQDRSSNGLTKETVTLNTGITAVPDGVYGNDAQTDDHFFKTSGGDIRTGEFILSIGDLINGTIYEASLLVTNKAGDSYTMDSVELLPSSQPQPVTQLKINTLSNDGFATTTDASSVKISGTWLDNDALSFRSFDVSGTSTSIYDPSDSLVKIRIGATTDISTAQGLFDATSLNLKFVEFYLTNSDLVDAADGGYALDRDINLIDELGKSYADLIVNGVGLTVQVVHDYKAYSVLKGIFTQEEADTAGFQQGELSDEITAYIQTQPVLADIGVSVTVSTGAQEFLFNGEILSKDVTQSSLVVRNDSTEIINGEVSLTDVTIVQQTASQLYAQIVSNQDITATLTVPDRNNLYSGGDAHTYTATKTFTTSKFRTPTNESVFTFTGNLGDTDQYLHTVLTNVNNETDNLLDSDPSESNVTWKLFDSDASDASSNGVLTNPVLVTNTYVTLNADVNISYTFDVSASYYLQIEKRCELSSAIVERYNTAGANLLLSETTVDVFSVHQGPIFFMQNPDLSAILVNVDVSTGDQRFFFNGQILSQDANDATLVVTNGSTEIRNVSVVLTGAVINEQSVIQIFDAIVTDQLITATLTQPDRNGTLDGDNNRYQYTAQVTFTPYKFKTPDAPSATLAKNLVGNDRTFKATLLNANDNYGYDIDNLTAQLADDSTSGLLSDVSGVFDIDQNETNQAQQNQTINLTRSAEFVVDDSYYLNVSKSYRLDNTVYTRYLTAARYDPVNETGVIETSPYAGPVYYMGNPVITGIDITEQNITITAETHGTELTPSDAFTLVLVAKDGLAGYATGVLTGNMGTTVTTNGTDLSTSDFTTTANANENQTVTYTFDFTASAINDEATCIGIVDVTNAHSAVSLKNFPDTTSGGLAENFNNSIA